MADTLITKQSYPVAATLTDLYTVPGATQAIIKGMVACNQGASSAEVRVSVALAGAADASAQYLVYDSTVEPNETRQILPDTVALATTDVLRVRSDTGYVSFNASVLEIT